MSNPSDPNRPASPDQPDPKKPDPKKPGDADWTPPGDEKQGVSGHSSFDFVLPEGTGSYSDLPPLPQPEGGDSGTNNAAVPPAPFVNPLSSQSFDFIDLPALPGDPLSGEGLGRAQPLPGDSVSVDSTVLLPTVGAVPPGGGESSAGLGAVPMAAPGDSSFTLGSSVADLALPPDVPDASALSTTSVPDIASVFPRPPVPGTDSGSLAEFDLPLAEPASDVFPAEPPKAEAPAGPAATTPTPDLESVLGGAEPVKPASGWLDQSVTPPPAKAGDAAAPPAAEGPRTPMSRSSFDFALPEGVSTYSDMPPVPQPDVGETAINQAALPPRPTATRPASNTFDFIDLPDAPTGGLSGSGLKNVSATPTPIEPLPGEPPLLTPTDNVIDLPAAQEAVAPVAGWLDSDVAPAQPAPAAEPVAEPTAELFESRPAAEPVESSDIFSGSRTAEALPVEQSDVIAATAFSGPAAAPAAPPGPGADASRPSDVALNFDAPPGGSTIADSDIPVADAATDSSTLLGAPAHDPESIHDMPGMSAPDPLFDSSKIAETPDLPAEPAGHDAPAYGAMPGYDPDASSILADLSDPDVRDPAGDSSSVRVDSPGGPRTGAEPAEGSFDLTVPEEPIPADLFGEPSEGTAVAAADWHSRSGTDLFAEGGTAPADADLVGGPSSTSNIFSGAKPPAPASSGGSGNVQVDATEPADLDAAEFSDAPELGATAETKPEAAPPRRPVHGLSSSDFALPPAAKDAEDAIDWDAVEPAGSDEATRGAPNDTSLSSVLRGLSDASTEVPTKDSQPLPADDTSTPVVTVDWMAGSAEGSAVKEPVKIEKERKDKAEPREEKGKAKPAKQEPKKQPAAEVKAKPERSARAAAPAAPAEVEKPAKPAKVEKLAGEEKARPAKKGGGMLVGMLAGALLAGGACAGAYFSGLVSNDTAKKGQQQPPPPPPPGTPVGSARDAHAAGNFTKALEYVGAKQAENLDDRATAGSVRVYSKIAGAGSDDDLKKGREDLRAVIDDPEAAKDGPAMKRAVKATVDLGASYEAAGDAAAAKKLFTEARAKYKPYAELFDALLDRLDTLTTGGAGGTSFRAPRLTPADAERALLAASVLFLQDQPAPKADDPEPGQFYWKALKLARAGNYDEAIKLIGQAKEAHIKRAKTFAGRGLNPLTDPLEQMFPRACDELAESWKLRAELYRNKAVADAIKKDGLAKTLDSLVKSQGELSKAQTDLKAEKDNLAKAKTDLKTVADNLKAEQKKVTNLEADLTKLDKQAKADKLAAEKNLDAAKTDIKSLERKLVDTSETLLTAQKDAKDRGEALNRIAKELAPAVKLPEKWTAADLTAAVKNLASVANDKDVKGLLDRVTKAETAAKVATDKLATEVKKLKADHDAEVKTLTDTYKADRKKLEDASAVEIKKLTDKLATDTKKLRDDHAAGVKKLNEEHATALKAEQAKTEAEKKAAALKEVTFQKQLANAVTPAQAVDIWLPVLTDLRRESDTAPALAMANRSLESSPAGSEEEAKARTLKGMALLLKRDYPAAREEFQAARRSPAYAADKPWAKVADNGLEATEDPLALYRQPVAVPPVDARAAAKSLDDGVAAYRAGKYQAAVTALTEAAKNDPADPVAWYYLGATRLAQGDPKQAEKDIAQGSEREKNSPKPGRAISDALAPIQGRARDAIDKARP